MYGDTKIDASVEVVKYDDYGNMCHLETQDEYEAGRKYKFIVRTTNFTEKLYNYKNDKNYTVDNSMVKASINGQKANITLGSGRPLICEAVVTMPGKRNPLYLNMSVSAADSEHSGFGYVDLGLPSGTKWATCNLGASKPESLGQRYAYGEVKTKAKFTPENFTGYGAYTCSNPHHHTKFAQEDNMFIVETSSGCRLKPEYDAPRQCMGGEWRLPTRAQCKELRENCYVKYVEINGVHGALYTSLKNGKSIYIPYIPFVNGDKFGGGALYMTANSRRVKGIFIYIWGSSYSKNADTGICTFQNNTYMCNEPDLGGNPSYLGNYIRAVWGGKDNISSKSSVSGKKSKSSDDSKDSKSSDENKENKRKIDKSKVIKTIGKGLKGILK